jgi:hypothetical protein
MSLSEWVALIGGIIIFCVPLWLGWKVVRHH